MRILFSFTGGSGHLDPLVPIARAAAAARHTVAFTGRAALVPAIERQGFVAFRTVRTDTAEPPPRRPLAELDAEREDRVLRDVFAGTVARERAAGILAIAARWRPELIVCDEVDFGAMVAAERLGLPHATVLVIAAGSFVRPQVVAEPLDALRAAHGLPADPELAMPGRHLVLSPFPPSLRDPAFPLPRTAHSLRPHAPGPVTGAAPLGLEEPAVYFTLGTAFNVESGDLFTRVLAGLRDLALELVVTVGEHVDPAELGAQPPTVHVERHVDQWLVLPHCRAVVSHGGSGSVMGALVHGLPSVLLPLGADQPLNAQRCAALGVARVLSASHATPADVHEAVSAVLTEPGYREAAERLATEIRGLPGPDSAVALLERLVTTAGAP